MTQNSMNAKELREALPPMVIWMADATIREARRSITGNTGWPKPNRNDYNLPEVEMAGEILFRMLEICSAAIKTALVNMPAEMDGVHDPYGRNYFDEFIAALVAYLARHAVRPRESDWILERL